MNRSRFAFFPALALAIFLAAIAPRLCAQATDASIHGTVTDPSGAVVSGAAVTAVDTSTGATAHETTNGSGYYIFPSLAVGGPYTVTIKLNGFKSFQSTGITLSVNANREVDAVLQTGAVSQTVQVSANPLQVQTSDTQLKTTVTSQQIERLPILGRDATILQKLTPGTVESSDRFGTFSANGNQTQENSYLLDGADVNDAPLQSEGIEINPDALGEITFVTGTQNPQYSRNSGAIINEILKSGTNHFHGDGFEFYRDTFLNNGGYFSTSRPPFHQNLYGGTLGGPVIPNKLFFFLAYQGSRNRTGVTQPTSVPSNNQLGRGNGGIAMLSDDYNESNQTGGLINGKPSAQTLTSNPLPFAIGACPAGEAWNACFKSGDINLPTSDFNAISSSLLAAYVPSPNSSQGGTPIYNFNALNTGASDQGIIRIDANLTTKDRIWGSSVFQSNPTTETLPFDGATLPGWGETDASHIKIFSGSWTHTFNPTTLNELRAGYYRFNFASVEPSTPQSPSFWGFTGITPQNAAAASMPYVGVTGYFTLGFSPYGPQPRVDTNYDYSDNFTKIVGNHNLMFGAHYERFLVHNPYYAENNGLFSFGGGGAYSSGDPLLDFLVGVPDQYVQGSGALIDAESSEDYAYAQDNWKVSSSFTFNYGLAYDVQAPFANLQYGGEAVICWVPGAQSKVFPTATPSNLYPGDPGCNDRGGATTKYDHFSPRIGFDWSPSQRFGWITGPSAQHLFSLRGGFGLYFNRDSEEAQLQNLEDPPYGTSSYGAGDFGGSPSFANPFVDIAGNGSEPNKFPYTFPTPGQTINFSQFVPYELSTIASNYDVPYAENFDLNIQRQLPGDEILTVGYVGTLGRHLVRDYEADQITPAGHAAAVAACQAYIAAHKGQFCSTLASALAYNDPQWFTETSGNFLSVGRVHTDGSSNYNSLQVQLQNRSFHGLYFDIGYTWSHALDNGSSFEGSGFGNSNDLVGTNWVPGYTQLSYGNSEYDARNRFYAGYSYAVPILASMKQHRLINEAIGGWNISGYTVLQSGFPVSIGSSDTNRSLYCNGTGPYTFYACPDTPEVSTFNIPTMNPRIGPNHYWFNPSLFSAEPVGTFGNVKRNFFSGPGYNYTDLNLFKNFPLGAADSPRYIQLRLEAYNAFNHPNFQPPDGSYADAGTTFGEVQNVDQPITFGGEGDPQPGRAIQLAGKFYF